MQSEDGLVGEEGLETMVQGHLGDHDNNGNLN